MGEGYNLFDLSVEAITWRGSKWRLLWFAKKSLVTSLVMVKIRQVLNKDKDSIQSLTMFCKKVLTRVGCCASVTLMTRSTQWMALWTNKHFFAICNLPKSPENWGKTRMRREKDRVTHWLWQKSPWKIVHTRTPCRTSCQSFEEIE